MGKKRSTRKQCAARTKSGDPCRNRVFELSDLCRVHLKQRTAALESDLGGITQPGPNERSILQTLEVFGPEEAIDAARYQMLRSLARAVDANPDKASLWSEYREALSELMKDANDADSSLDEAFQALRSAPEVVDP